MTVLRLHVEGLDAATAASFERTASSVAGVSAVDTWPDRAEIAMTEGAAEAVRAALADAGFRFSETDAEKKTIESVVRISGMTCRSCEVTVERRFKKIAGVVSVDVNAAKGVATITSSGAAPLLDALQDAVKDDGYLVKSAGEADMRGGARPSLLEAAGLFAAVFLLGAALSRLGIINGGFNVGGATNFFAAAVLGLVAGSSSCMAVSGGLLLSSTAAYRERYGKGPSAARMRPVALFVAGRTASYGILGGVIGLVGSALSLRRFLAD